MINDNDVTNVLTRDALCTAGCLAGTRLNEEDWHHPEQLVATMPYTQAKEWQARLRDMAIGDKERCSTRDQGGQSCPIGGENQ